MLNYRMNAASRQWSSVIQLVVFHFKFVDVPPKLSSNAVFASNSEKPNPASRTNEL